MDLSFICIFILFIIGTNSLFNKSFLICLFTRFIGNYGRSSRGRLYFLVEGEGDALARLQYVQDFIRQRQYGWFALTSANRTQVMEVKFSRKDPYHVDVNFEFFMPKGEDFYDLFDVDSLCAYTKEEWLEGRLPCDIDVGLVFDR